MESEVRAYIKILREPPNDLKQLWQRIENLEKPRSGKIQKGR